jgi:hypothetical protein
MQINAIGPTTAMNGRKADEPVLTGTEDYPILGEKVSPEVIAEIMGRCKGLTTRWDCERKARIAQDVLGKGYKAVVGSLLVVSGDEKSEYGYFFNPPYEFHAWVVYQYGGILDVSLPGVIDTGLNFSDDIGPYLVDREPVILNGKAPAWLKYKAAQYL